MNAIILVCIFLLQIPQPTIGDERFTVWHLQGAFQTQVYLQIAMNLQKLDEQDRINKLYEWSKIESLDEAVVILCRMLIEKKDGKPLRPPYWGTPEYLWKGKTNEFPDSPLFIYKNVPFLVVTGYDLAGPKEKSSDYLEYALETGQWRDTRYQPFSKTKLSKIANELVNDRIGKLDLDEFQNFRWTARIDEQIGEPRPSTKSGLSLIGARDLILANDK